ncbi:MAG: hypothetical protein L3J59_11040 [Methylococcaceae bacterium]|nr:hypothetical protein [Methylococcaceae bacterium]
MRIVRLAKCKKWGSLTNCLASKIASQAGEKTLVFSEMAMPKLLCANAPASFNPSPIISTCFPCFCKFFIKVNLSSGF